jgi:predicted small lipoprotein YifL
MVVINSAGIIAIMRRVMSRTAGLLLVLALLSACGTKGPLYLPTPEQKAQQQKQQDNKQQPPRQ